jgi:hypothetical protein
VSSGYAGIGTAARIPIIATTIINSIRVKPIYLEFFIFPFGKLFVTDQHPASATKQKGRTTFAVRPRYAVN